MKGQPMPEDVVPAGYVLAPIEPTEAMIDAFVACALQYSVSSQNGGWTAYAREQWRTMIRALKATPDA